MVLAMLVFFAVLFIKIESIDNFWIFVFNRERARVKRRTSICPGAWRI